MSIGSVTLMTPAEKAKVQQDMVRYERLQQEINILNDDLNEAVKKMSQAIRQEAEELEAEGIAGKAAATQNIANLEANRIKLHQESDHKLLLIAISKVIVNRFNPSKEAMAKATTPEARKALQTAASKKANEIVEDFMKQYESRGILLSYFSEDAQCMHLTENTVPVILKSMKKAEWSSADLTKFRGKIDPKALNSLLESGQLTDALFASEAEDLAKEQLNKGIRVFVLKDNVPTEIKSVPMSISTSTKSTPSIPNVKKDSPDNSPPKAIIQVAKPLPAVPPKPLPKPPARKEAALEAK